MEEPAAAAPPMTVGWTDGQTIQSLLMQAIVSSLQDAAVSEEDLQQLLPALQEYSGNVALRVSAVAPSDAVADDLLSTMNLPEHVDDEVISLRNQIDQANAEIAELRQQVPVAIIAAMAQQLQQLRPLPSTHGAAEEQAQAELEDVPVPTGEFTQQLQQLAKKLPSTRARVEEAVQRLSRILGAVECDQARGPPRTVEKVILNKLDSATPGGSASAAEDDAGAELDAGVRMKARLAHDLLVAAGSS